jgi:hypothetical protein
MATSIIINALIQKRAEIGGLITDLEARAKQARANLAHIDATLALFDPAARPHEIRNKRPTPRGAGVLAVGEISRRIRDALREASGPIMAESIVLRAMTEKGLDAEDKALRLGMVRSFVWSLQRMHVTGTVRKTGLGLGARWGAPEDALPRSLGEVSS